MTQTEKMFVVKALTMRLGATRAHNLYSKISKMKGGEPYVHGTSDDFKNHIRDVNAFIGESDAQMLIPKMENRKKFVPNFTFQYKVENSELVTMFWADEVDKCNYKEFEDIISFDATFRTNKYDMICKEIYDETDFKERFNKIMWNMFMEQIEFEEKWSKLIEDFGLQNYKWMTKMFNLRRMWLSAYFIDSPLFGLMRTTSRSESENAFFKSFTNHGSTLVNFMMCFESAMERQRYRQEVLDFRTFDSSPKLHTKLKIEIYASKVYTRKIFLLIQKEIIEAVWACQIQEFKTEEGCEIVKVRDRRAAAYRTLNTEKVKEEVRVKEYESGLQMVLRSLEDGSVECTCRHFLRYGFLCRHVFCVLKNRDIEVIPENKDEDKLAKFVEQLKNIKNEVQSQVPKPPSQKTGDVIEDIYAFEKPKQNNINNPQGAINKGGRRGERRKSGRELALKAKTKQSKKCGHCGEKTNKHTKTTCLSNPKYIAKLARIAAEQTAKDAAEDATKNDVAAEQPKRTDVVEEPTNAS
ncbi:FAR1-related sequence 5-like protein [Tanacetum coccineum]